MFPRNVASVPHISSDELCTRSLLSIPLLSQILLSFGTSNADQLLLYLNPPSAAAKSPPKTRLVDAAEVTSELSRRRRTLVKIVKKYQVQFDKADVDRDGKISDSGIFT